MWGFHGEPAGCDDESRMNGAIIAPGFDNHNKPFGKGITFNFR
jgi:hypothetical protein